MVVKKKRIQVPESIAEEVKLFARLLELGEIGSTVIPVVSTRYGVVVKKRNSLGR